MGRVIVVGERPAKVRLQGRPALVGSPSGMRLAVMCGLEDDDELLDRFVLVNVLRTAGDDWPAAQARSSMASILQTYRGTAHRLVFLGSKVAEAAGVQPQPWFRWRVSRGVTYATSPHPSGRSRSWNDTRVRVMGREFWRDTWEYARAR